MKHSNSIKSAEHKNGCHNRHPYVYTRVVQEGYFVDGYELRARAMSLGNFSVGAPCHYTR